MITLESKLLIVVHGLMLAWLVIDVLLLRRWIKQGTPPRLPDTILVAIAFAAVIAWSLVYLVSPAVEVSHEGGSHAHHDWSAP